MNSTKNKTEAFFTKTVVVVIGALLCTALWGSATPAIKIGYEHILPERNVPSTILFAGVRFFLSGIITVAIYSIARKRLLYPKLKNLHRVGAVSAFQTVLQYIFFYIGLSNTTGVKGTIASGASAFFPLFVSAFIFRQEKFTAKKLIASLIGFSGIVVANLSGLTLDINFLGDGFVLISTFFYAISSVLIKKFSAYEDTVVIIGYQFVFGGAVLVAVGLILGGRIELSTLTGVLILIYLACLSAVAYSVWGLLFKYNPVSRVSIFSFMTSVFGVIFSAIFLKGEADMSVPNIAIALVLVSAGIFMLNYQPKEKSK